MRILVHGHLGMGNLGDELMLDHILSALSKRFPAARLVVAAGNYPPQPLLENPQVELVPRTLTRLCLEITRCRIFVIAGGTHLASFRGASRHLRGIIRQLLLVLLARMTFSRVFMLSVGFGPFEEPHGERLAKLLLRLTHFVSVRDSASLQWLSTLSRPADSYSRCHDAALFTPRKQSSHERPVLGISLMPYFANYGGFVEKDEAIVEQFVPIVESWQSVYPDAEACLYSFLKQDSIYADNRVLGMLKERFSTDDRIQLIDQAPNLELAQDYFARFTHFISMRYHSQVLAWLNEVPQLCITYHRKNRLFAAEYGISKQACFDVNEVLAGELNSKVADFFHHPERYAPSVSLESVLSNQEDILPAKPSNQR